MSVNNIGGSSGSSIGSGGTVAGKTYKVSQPGNYSISLSSGMYNVDVSDTANGLSTVVGSTTLTSTASRAYFDTAQSNLTITAGAPISWSLRTGLGSNISAVTYGNGLFIAGGQTGGGAAPPIYLTSTDGISWTTRTPTGWGNTAITYLNYLNGNYIMSSGVGSYYGISTDGLTWTTRAISFGTTNLNAMTYANGIYVAVGNSSQIRTSTDGITWTTRSSGFTASSTLNFPEVIYGNGLFIATSTNIVAITVSTDGVTWTSRTVFSGGSQATNIAYGNGNYVLCGASTIYSSTDAITWTTRTSASFGTGTTINAISYGSGVFLVGGGSTSRAVIDSSSDGITWTNRYSAGLSQITAMAYGGNQYGLSGMHVATQNAGQISSSSVYFPSSLYTNFEKVTDTTILS